MSSLFVQGFNTRRSSHLYWSIQYKINSSYKIIDNSGNIEKRFKTLKRLNNAVGQNRTVDTRIFSPLLYRLSYNGKNNRKFISDFFICVKYLFTVYT